MRKSIQTIPMVTSPWTSANGRASARGQLRTTSSSPSTTAWSFTESGPGRMVASVRNGSATRLACHRSHRQLCLPCVLRRLRRLMMIQTTTLTAATPPTASTKGPTTMTSLSSAHGRSGCVP